MSNRDAWYSCGYIEGGLNFQWDSLTYCCLIHANNKGYMPIEGVHVEGDRLPIEKISADRKRLVRKLQDDRIDLPCRGCPHLQKRDWGDTSGQFHEITINSWTICNLKCEYCYTRHPSYRALPKENAFPLMPVLRNMVAEDAFSPGARIGWGGGEITLLSGFDDAMKMFLQTSISHLINTNAVLYSALIDKAIAAGKAQVQVSVDSGTPETYHRIKGSDKFHPVWQHIQRYATTAEKYCPDGFSVKYILYEANSSTKEIDAFFRMCRDRNVRSLIVAARNHVDRPNWNNSDEVLRMAGYMFQEARRLDMTVRPWDFGPEEIPKIEEHAGVVGTGALVRLAAEGRSMNADQVSETTGATGESRDSVDAHKDGDRRTPDWSLSNDQHAMDVQLAGDDARDESLDAPAEVQVLKKTLADFAAALKDNYRRAVEGDGAAEYYRHLVHGAEGASRDNYERAVSAEADARENYERALVAEQALRDSQEHAERAEAGAKGNYERALSAEASAKENYERALSAEAAAKENYERALSAEAAAKENYERALSAEASAKENYERALSAEASAKENYEQFVAAERAQAHEQERAAAAEALAGSLSLQIEELSVEARRATQLSAELDALEQQFEEVQRERNHYRRRWPPYIVKRVTQKSAHWCKRRVYAWANPRAVKRFGLDARFSILFTGLPADGEADALHSMLNRQTRGIHRLVLPGQCAGVHANDQVQEILVENWWAPDLARLLDGEDYALVLHPEDYGPGPLWSPLALEMMVAALASDFEAAAVVLRGKPGPPEISAPNHLHETDEASIASWSESGLAAVFRREAILEAFPPANPGEARNIRETLIHLLRTRRRVLVVPQTFPTTDKACNEASAAVGTRLPAEPRSTLRGLYLTQWIECGGADKGMVDLLTHVDPTVIDFSLMTTIASRHQWEDRLRGHVREICHTGAHLPLPADKLFPEFVVEYVRRRNIGLIHIMHSTSGYDALPALRSAVPGVKILDQCHILEPPDNMGGGHPAYSSKRYKKYFDHRTVTSQWLKRYLTNEHGIPADKISVIYTCVDWADEFNPERYPSGAFREQIDVPGKASLVVFMGRLHWQKRPWLFVQIAEQVQRQRPDLDAYFVLVGPGPEYDRLEAMRKALRDPGRVILAGEVKHGAAVLRDADLMLMPSGHEGLAYVSYEAMAMTVPQIFTDVNGQSELITPETGMLLPPEDEEAVVQAGTQAVIDLLADPPRRQAMGQAARERVCKEFGLEVMVKGYEALYRQLARTR